MKILDSEVNFKENLFYSLNRFRVLWLILLITMVFDYITSVFFISQLGVRAEANVVMDWLIKNFGLGSGLFIGKSLQLLPPVFFVSLNKRFGSLFLLFVILVNIWAVFINA